MNRQQVQSSDINSIGYDNENSVLEIEFLSGGIYQYSNVPINIYNDIMNALSHGKYFHQNIKDSFNFIKIR